MRRVVITGMGAQTPVANGARATWDALVAGHSGIERITLFDPSPYTHQLAGEVKNFDNSSIDAKEVRHMDRYVQFAVVATQEALADAAGIDRTYVSALERRKYSLSIDRLDQLAATLGVEPHILLMSETPQSAG